jgi:hypothetical protein
MHQMHSFQVSHLENALEGHDFGIPAENLENLDELFEWFIGFAEDIVL